MSHESRTSPPTYPEILDIHDGAFSESIWGSDGFRTIKVTGQDDVVADSYKDNLTIAAGTNVTLTTNEDDDTLTIAATPGTVYTAGTGITINGSEISVSAVALTTVQTAANQTAHLALTAQEGDVVVRTDENKSYVRNSGTAGNMSDYTLLATPTDLVLSVAGNTGAVTAAQIKTAYEGNAQTNAFTDTEKTKLSGIETGATADQTDEEIQDIVGGMLTGNTETGITVTYEDGDGTIDFVVATQSDNNFTNTLKSKLDGIENSATADQTDAEIRAAVEAATDSNVFTDADHTKLNAIEASADVTDTTNVTSAGAVMKTTVDALGDLLVASADNTVTRLARGTDGYILKSNSSTGTGLEWTAAGSGGDVNQNAFSNIAVSGQTTVAADSTTDTFTLVAGNNVTLTTDDSADSITIAASNTDATKMPLAGGIFTGNVRWNDGNQIRLGNDADLKIYHDSTNFITNSENLDIRAKNTNGGLITISDSAGENLIKATAGSSVELTYDGTKKFETTSAGATVTGTLTATLADNSIANTAQISNGVITHNNLAWDCVDDTNIIDNSIKSEHYVDGSIDTAHIADNQITNAKMADDAVGIAELSATGTASSSTYLRGDNSWATVSSGGISNIVEDTSPQLGGDLDTNSFEISLDDDHKVKFGGSAELTIHSDGTNGVIRQTNNQPLYIQGDNFIQIGKANAATPIYAKFINSGAVDLYYDGNKKFETLNTGANITGSLGIGTTTPNKSSVDAAISVNGSSSSIVELCTGDARKGNIYTDGTDLYMTNNSTGWLGLFVNNTEKALKAIKDGGVELYFNDTKKAETVTGGFTVSGTCTATSFAGDGSALTGLSSAGTGEKYVYYKAGATLSNSGNNTYAGYEAGNSLNASSAENTLYGYRAGKGITAGEENVAIGLEALESAAGDKNVAVGKNALQNYTGSSGVAVGYQALKANTSGTGNVGIGSEAGAAITTGEYNNFVGMSCGKATTTGSKNQGFGYACLIANTTGQYNSAYGQSAMITNTTGSNNVSVGYWSMRLNTTGGYNVAVGYEALKQNTTASLSTAIGYQALRDATTGGSNTALGREALLEVTTGVDNTGCGRDAGYKITTGAANTCIGKESGDNITTGSNNTCIGYNTTASAADVSNEITLGDTSVTKFRIPGINFTIKDTTATDNYVLTVDSNGEAGWEAAAGGGASAGELYVRAYNVGSLSSTGSTLACGDKSGESLTSADENAFYGYEAGRQCTSGDRNTFIGSQAGENTTTKDDNTAVGSEAMRQNTTGEYNTAVGQGALQNNTTGDKSTAVGYRALRAQSSTSAATQNAAVGFGAAENLTAADSTAMGYGALGSATTGDANTCFGNCAGGALTTGTQNTFLGNRADQSATTASHCIVIGSWAELSANDTSGEIVLGTTNNDDLRCNTQTISALSDARDKTDIVDLPTGLDFVNSLRPVKFKWETREGNIKDGKYAAGFLAQDLQAAEEAASSTNYTDLVSTKNLDKLEAKYGNLVPILVQAVKELSAKVNTLENTLNNG